MSGAQRFINGMTIDNQKGRFSGTFDLEDYDIDQAGLDEVGVAIVVFRVSGASPKITKKGELEQTSLFAVQEFRIADEELGEALIARLGLLSALSGTQLTLDVGGDDEPEPDFDRDTGEVFTPPPPQPESDTFNVTSNGQQGGVTAGQVTEPIPAGVGANGTRVGAVYPAGRKDSDLAKFLDS